MEASWFLYRFDYARYLAVRPALRSATTPAAFAALADGPEANAIVEAFTEGELSVEEARMELAIAFCCVGDPLPFDKTLPRNITALLHTREGEDAADLLAEMLTGGRNREGWLAAPVGIVGFLTPQETLKVAEVFAALASRGRLRIRRRGGLAGLYRRFLSGLLDRGPQPEEQMRLLRELLRETARNGEGIAALTA